MAGSKKQSVNKRVISIHNLSQKVNEEILEQTFSSFGPLHSVHIAREQIPTSFNNSSTNSQHTREEVEKAVAKKQQANSSHKGIAYIEFESQDDATHACFNMNQSEYFGETLSVNFYTQSATILASLPASALDPSQPLWNQQETMNKQGEEVEQQTEMMSDDWTMFDHS